MFNIHEYERRLELQNSVQRRDKKQLKENFKIKRKYTFPFFLFKFTLITERNDELCKNYRHRIGSFINKMMVDPKL